MCGALRGSEDGLSDRAIEAVFVLQRLVRTDALALTPPAQLRDGDAVCRCGLAHVVTGDEAHRLVIHDRDTIYTDDVDRTFEDMGLTILKPPFAFRRQ
jgi:hypothetical protein